MSDPTTLKNQDPSALIHTFEPGAETPGAADHSFEARQILADHLKDQSFQDQIDDRQRTVELFAKLRPDLSSQQIRDNLPALFESLTGQKHVDGVNAFERAVQAVDSTLKAAQADAEFWRANHVDPMADALRQLNDRPDSGGLTGADRIDAQTRKVKQDRAAQIAELDQAVQKVQVDHGGPWWFTIVDNAANLGTSVGQMAPEAALGFAAGGPAGGVFGAWDASSRLMAASSFRTMVERGVSKDIADEASMALGYAAGAVDVLEVGSVAGIALKQITKKAAMASAAPLARALAINLAKGATAVAVGTGEEVAQEAISIAGENAGYQAENARRQDPTETTREVLRQNILDGILDYNKSAPIPLDSPEQIADRLANTAVSSAIGLATLGAFGVGLGTAHTRAQLKKWDQEGVLREKVQAVAQDAQAEKAIAAAEPQPEAKVETKLSDTSGEPITVYHPADTGLAAGHADLGAYGNGVRFFTDLQDAETQSRAMSTGPLMPSKLVEAMRVNYPAPLVQAVQAVIHGGMEAAEPYRADLEAWNKAEEGMADYHQLLDLAESIHTGTPLEDRNDIVRQYGLQAALPSGGILEAKIQADKIAHADSEAEIDRLFKEGAQAVEFDGAWHVKDPARVVVTKKLDSQVERGLLYDVGKVSYQANENTLRALSSNGDEAGRLTLERQGNTVRIRDIQVPEDYRRQGVARGLVARVIAQNPGRTIDWGKVETPEAKAFQQSVRESFKSWEPWGSKIEAAQSPAEAELLRRKADTIPDPGHPEGRPLDGDQLREILSKELTHDEADVVLAVAGHMAEYLGTDLDTFLAQALHDVRWVDRIRDEHGLLRSKASGATLVAEAGKRIIELARGKANVSTILHEMAHVLRPMLKAEDMATLLAWTGEKEWNRDAEERFARGFEQYLGEGRKTGDEKADGVMAKMAAMFRSIYEALFKDPMFRVGGKAVEMTDEVRAVFDKILTGEDARDKPGTRAQILGDVFANGGHRLEGSVDHQGSEVKVGALFQESEDPAAVTEKSVAANRAKLEAFRLGLPGLKEKLSKGKTLDEKKALEKYLEEFVAAQEKAIAADQHNLVVFRSSLGPDPIQARSRAIQEAVEKGRPVPDAWLEAFKREPWAKAELDRRADLRDQLEHARAFDDLDAYLGSIVEDRVMEALGDPFQVTDEDEARVRAETVLSPEEYDRFAQIYGIAHAKTPEQLDKEFADSLTPDKVKQILAGMAQGAYIADKALPRHVLAQVTKSQEGRQTNEAEIPRILKTMQKDPRTYRKIAQQGFADAAELEALAIEETVEKATRDAQDEQAAPEIKPITIPSELNIEDAVAIRTGTASRMEWQRKALDAQKEAEQLERAMETLERFSDRWTDKAEEVQTGVDEALDAEALAVLGQDQVAKLRMRLRDLAKEAGGDRTQSRDRVVSLISDLVKHLRGLQKVREATARAQSEQAEQMRKMGHYLAKPAPKTISVEYQRIINANAAMIDPHFRSAKKARLLQAEAQWWAEHPEYTPPPQRKGELFGKNLNLWTYQELHAAYTERKALEEMGRAAMIAKKLNREADRMDTRSLVLGAIYNQGAVLQAQMEAAEKAGDTVKRQKLAEKYLAWEMKRAERLRNINSGRNAQLAWGGGTHLLTISNLADKLDGFADWKGINHQTLWGRPNTAENQQLAEMDRRKRKFFGWIKESGIDLARLKDRIQIPGVETDFSVDDLITLYVGQKNERKNAALVYGNRIDRSAFEFINQAPEMAWARKLGDRLIEEYDENKERLFKVIREYENFDPIEEDAYTPMSRAEINMESLDAQAIYEQAVAAQTRQASIEHGFTETRVNMDPEHQKPIKLGEFGQWLDNITRQEMYIAYTPVIQDLKSIYGDSEVKDAIRQVHGTKALEEIDNYIKSLANRYHDKTFGAIDRIVSKITQNAALAYMAYNVATVLKQASSLPLFIPHCRPDLLIASMGKMVNPWALIKKVDGLSVQMRTRVGYADLDSYRLAAGPAPHGATAVGTAIKAGLHEAEKALHKVADPGMKPMQWMDKLIAAAGWDAAYETAKAKGLLGDAAVEYADWVVGRTQQSTHAKDTAGIMRSNNSLVKAMTLFAGPSVKVFNEMVYGTRAQLKNGHYLKSFGTMLGICASALLFYGLGKGAPPDDEGELAQWLALGFANQIPALGPALSSMMQGYDSGNLLINQAAESAFKTGAALTTALNDEDEAKRARAWPKAAQGGLDVLGLGLGAPVSPIKRTWKAIQTGNGWELVGWHHKE